MQGDLNLNNPIFVYYLNCDNVSRQHVEETIDKIRKQMTYNNITLWIVPCEKSRIECIYDGFSMKRSKIKRIYSAIEKMIDDPTLSQYRQEMRDILLDDIFEDVKE